MTRGAPPGDTAGIRAMAVVGAVLGAVIGGGLHFALDARHPLRAFDRPEAGVEPAPSTARRPPPLAPFAWPIPASPTTAGTGAAARDSAAEAPQARRGPPATTSARDAPRMPPDAAASFDGMPYRVLGRTGTGSDAALVLFGRGRVVTVRGPGPLDAEHAVDHVADDHVLIRHLPSGAGLILPLGLRSQASDLEEGALPTAAD